MHLINGHDHSNEIFAIHNGSCKYVPCSVFGEFINKSAELSALFKRGEDEKQSTIENVSSLLARAPVPEICLI